MASETQIALNNEAVALYERARSELEELIRVINQHLRASNEAAWCSLLERTQSAWCEFVALNSDLHAFPAANGSMAPLLRYGMLRELYERRHRELAELFRDVLEQ